MKVLITGGGTGGHIYPAISIAKELEKNYDNIEILYIGTKKGLESELVPKAGIKFKTITVSGFKRSITIENLKTIKNLAVGLIESQRIIRMFKPDIVIGTGGYVCGPIVLMASLMNVKCAIHEQNVIPGITNKILSKFVEKIFISFEDSRAHFNVKSNKVVFTGNPIRDDFLDNSNMHRFDGNSKSNKFKILSFGGSRGAKTINETMLETIKEINNIPDIHLTHITGKYYYNDFMDSINNIKLNSNIKILPYVDEMPSLMKSSDIIISRSGAITLAEITALGRPAILVPSPNVANNHQEYNAKVLEKHGAAVVLLEKQFNYKNLIDLLLSFKNDKIKLEAMGVNSKKLGIPNANKNIIINLLSILDS